MTSRRSGGPPRRPEQSPEHRRWLVRTLVAVVVAVTFVVGGPWVYAKYLAPDPAPPLVLEEPETRAPDVVTEPEIPPVTDLEGSWTLGEGSEIGYRLEEVLSGQDVTVVGRTSEVSGDLVVEDDRLVSAEVGVDMATITTDEAARDAYFRRAIDTTTHPDGVFELGTPIDLEGLSTATEPMTVDVDGALTFHGASRPVTGTFEVRRTADGFEAAGSFPVLLEDYGLDAPDLGFVTVAPEGLIEMKLVLTR